MEFVVISEKDSVKVSLDNGHKYARRDIKCGEHIIKYGLPIGVATRDIKEGELVHSDSLKTVLSGVEEYEYNHTEYEIEKADIPDIKAYIRKNGDIGIRNDIWIIPTVGCVNKTAEEISRRTGTLCFTHPYGCSQLGDDHTRTKQILRGLIKHPNAGGVLVLGLGCENNNINELKEYLGEFDSDRIKFLNSQDCEDEIEEGVKVVRELEALTEKDERVSVSANKLKIGLKCGGSDGLSGITANALVGKVSDAFTAFGASAVLTEVPEIFGAEQLLLNRCESEVVFNKAVKMINGFKKYFMEHNQPISENPSPGNKEGGITTLEEKSLGCVQKGGLSQITDVLSYGDTVKNSGLNLLDGPGNDIVAVTNLTAAGCHIILFTTGRGTPLGAPVPTLKISSNTGIALKKKNWIDFDAMVGSKEKLINLIIETVNGRQTKNELNANRQIAIFKDGVTL